jgi:hypothetical protein
MLTIYSVKTKDGNYISDSLNSKSGSYLSRYLINDKPPIPTFK